MATEKALIKKIERIKQQIIDMGDIHPGSISKQYNICGTPGCKCKDKESPQKHGPYSNLSYRHKKKSKTKFLRDEIVGEYQEYTSNYKQLKKHVAELVETSVELIQLRNTK